MGNFINETNKFHHFYYSLDDSTKDNIDCKFKVVNVDWLDTKSVNRVMAEDVYFTNFPQKAEAINDMLNSYLNHEDEELYRKTDYLCNLTEQVCICNTHAEDFRKIYNGSHYRPGKKYVNWCVKAD